jgi:predicted Zn-dependent peptidase
MKFKKTTLPNGVRIIVVPAHDNPSATVMVAAETGSHYESKEENGLSHFLEHMLFKGTPSRPTALSVSTELDTIGAESNAFTSSDATAYYAKSEKRHWQKLLEVVSDMYLNPSFPAADLEKERGVILQEIAMYNDLPQEQVWEELAKLLYGDTPAGRSIAGLPENVKKFSRQDFLSYHRKHYVASKTIVVVAGDVEEKEVVEEAKKIFGELAKVKRRGKEKLVERQKAPALALKKKRSDQTHLVLAVRGYPLSDKRTPAVSILMGILGAGMSSRLFQRVREQMGAAYYVNAGNIANDDRGYVALWAGVEAKRAAEVTQALIDECKRLAQEEVQEKELQKVKDYLASHLYMRLETTDALAGFYLNEEVVRGEVREPQAIEAALRKVTAKEVREAAKELFRDESLNLAVVGNVANAAALKKALTFK